MSLTRDEILFSPEELTFSTKFRRHFTDDVDTYARAENSMIQFYYDHYYLYDFRIKNSCVVRAYQFNIKKE